MFKEDLKRVKQEWEHKLHYENLSFQKALTEETSKHKYEVNQIQSEVQKAYEEKILEIEGENESEIEKNKNEFEEVRDTYERAYEELEELKRERREVENVEREKEEEISVMKENIENEMLKRIEEIGIELDSIKEENEHMSSALNTEKDTTKELISKLQNSEFKINDLEDKISQLLQENGSLNSQLKDDYKNKNLENKIRENMALSDEIDQLKGKFCEVNLNYYRKRGESTEGY